MIRDISAYKGKNELKVHGRGGRVKCASLYSDVQ
jgi:hypothetical protein